MNRRDAIIEKIGEIPTMPPVVMKMTQLLSNPDVSFRELSETLKYDPGMTANVLRLANSAYFGFRHKVDSIHQGIVRLGTKRMYELVIAAAVSPMAIQEVRGYDLPAGKLWEHSVHVAVGTEELASLLRIKLPEFAFTAGLLHDIGKIVLGTFIDVDVKPILQLVNHENMTFNDAEREILGINHAEVGALLFKKWDLPQSIIDVIEYHHEPRKYSGDSMVVKIVHIADALALMSGIGTGKDGLRYRLSQQVIDSLNLTTQLIETCACLTMAKVEELLTEITPQ